MIVGPIIERWGHKWAMLFTCIIQIAGAVIGTVAQTQIQYGAGRCLTYMAIGLVSRQCSEMGYHIVS
jgi:MFS family permease